MTMQKRFFIAVVLLLGFSMRSGAQSSPVNPSHKPAPAAAKPANETPSKRAGRPKMVEQVAKSQPKPWQKIPIPTLPAFHPQQPKRIEFSNGMVVFLQEDHELPLIDGSLRIRGGSRIEPAEKVGLVSIYGQAWRTGGTMTTSGDQLDDFLEARAAKVETSGGIDSTDLSWSCLKGDFPDVLKIVADLLRHPAFREDKIALAKQQLDTAISRRNDNPGQIAARESAKLAYGDESPYARTAEYYTVAAVTRQDLVNWHAQFAYPNNIILGVTGDFDSAAMEKQLRAAFGNMPKGPEANHNVDIAITPANPGMYFIQKDDVNQSTVSMVHLGIKRDNPDYYGVTVMNEILGGGFSGRLMANLRTKQGLAYDVHGGVGARYDHPGVFELEMETKSGTTAAAIDGLYAQLADLEKNPATAFELKRAKDSILNSFIFDFDEKDKVLAERVTYEFYGYPANFLERFRTGIEKVTADDVDRVAHKYIHENRLAVLVLGNAADFDRQLSTFGRPVTKINISIPEAPPGKTAVEAPPAASNPEGKALAAKVAAALGGEAKLRDVKAIKQSFTSMRKTPQGDIPLEVEQIVMYPDHVFASMQTPMGAVDTLITPTTGMMSIAGNRRELPSAVREENLKTVKRDIIYVTQHINDPKYTFTADGTEKIGDLETRVVNVNADGAEMRWYVEPASGRVPRVEFHTVGPEGPADRVVNYSNWRNSNGLSLPYKRAISENGEAAVEDTFKTIEINPVIDPKLFEAPATKAR